MQQFKDPARASGPIVPKRRVPWLALPVILVQGMLAMAVVSALTPFPAAPAVAGEGAVRMSAVNWAAATRPATGPAQAIGGYAGGCMIGAVALPLDGEGYQVIRPSRLRNYGQPQLVRFLQDLGRKADARHLGILMIADMSQPRGGPMPNGHASHQIGLDADVWLRLDQPRLPPAQREAPVAVSVVDFATATVNQAVWSPQKAALIRLAAEDPRVSRLFVNPAIKEKLCNSTAEHDRGWLHKVRPWWGHDAHMHVRLACPAGNAACEEQKEPPPGDGCGEEVESWLADMRKPPEPKPPGAEKPRTAMLPAACVGVLNGKAAPAARAELPVSPRG